tara:strand:+ start:102 stop:320 length:219 start_codon:yes stop_codon:yes gene_type:complete
MKEQSLIEMKNKIQSLTNVMEHMMQELDYLRTVSFGTLETIKQMSEYDNALGIVKEKVKEDKKHGAIEPDTK